jgi:futalosine hydrolase
MKILLVSATKFELLPLFGKMKAGLPEGPLQRCHLGKQELDVLITGVGMTSTAFHLGRIFSKKYDLAINAGLAGSFKRKIPCGTVVNVTQDCFADIGAEDGNKFITLKEMGLQEGPQYMVPFKHHAGALPVPQRAAMRHLAKVTGITVNTVHGNELSIRKAVKKFNPDVESMEGAAFFFACNYCNTPSVQVRAISNYVERRNKKNWKLNLAIENLNTCLEKIILAG